MTFDSLVDVYLHPNSILHVENLSTSVCVCVFVYVSMCLYTKQQNVSFMLWSPSTMS
jgi:hypothetical protein